MKTTINNKVRKSYNSPKIERVLLDNEISLILESSEDNPFGEPDWTQANFNNDPFKSTLC